MAFPRSSDSWEWYAEPQRSQAPNLDGSSESNALLSYVAEIDAALAALQWADANRDADRGWGFIEALDGLLRLVTKQARWSVESGATSMLAGAWGVAASCEATADPERERLLALEPETSEQRRAERDLLEALDRLIEDVGKLRRLVQQGHRLAGLDYIRERVPRETQWWVFAACGYVCVQCGKGPGVPLTVDHILPVSKGGSDRPYNLQALCGPCNFRERDTDSDE